MIKVYVKEYGARGSSSLVPHEKYRWTGKIKYQTIDGKTTIYLQRWVCLFGLKFLPIFLYWENEKYIIFQEEETLIYECEENAY